MLPERLSLFIGILAVGAPLVLLLRLGMSQQAKRSRAALLARGGQLGVLIAETNKSLTQGLRSAFPEYRSGSTAQLVPWRFLLSWNHDGVQFWEVIGRPSKPLVELGWNQISLSVTRVRLEKSMRVTLDMQLSDGPIHVQMALRHDRRGLPYYSIDETNTLVDELDAVAARAAE